MLIVNAQWTKSSRYPLNKKISPHHVEQAPDIHNIKCHAPRERVSWNPITMRWILLTLISHAPRERVSWNIILSPLWIILYRHAPRERVSWNDFLKGVVTDSGVTLHVSVWVEISFNLFPYEQGSGHAPRERVSWNHHQSSQSLLAIVTLHVSVWVEILVMILLAVLLQSRSTWACELKWSKYQCWLLWYCHAPRERVSWNFGASIFHNLH